MRYVFELDFSENHFEIGKDMLCICEQALSLKNCLCSCSFFSLNTYIMWCDHAVELVLQLLAWESTSLSDAFILHGPYLFIWANPFEKACCGIRGVGKIEDLKGNLPWICLGAQLQLILSSKTFPKSPTEYVKPHFSHVFLIVIA